MSYTIIYDKQFIEAGDYYIPIFLLGSNNCFDYSGAREREWYVWDFYGYKKFQILYTKDEIMKLAENEVNILVDSWIKRKMEGGVEFSKDDAEKSIGEYMGVYLYGTRTINKTNFLNLFKYGIKRAFTVEQLRGIANFSLDVKDEKNKERIAEIDTSSTEKMIATIKEVESIVNKENLSVYTIPYFCCGGWRLVLPTLKKLKKQYFNRRTRKVVNQDYYYVLEHKDFTGSYLCGLVPHGYKYSYYTNAAKRFRTEREAERYLKKIGDRGDKWKITLIKKPAVSTVST